MADRTDSVLTEQLMDTPLFAQVDEFLMEQVANDSACVLLSYQKGSMLPYKEGHIGVLLSGLVRVENANGCYISRLSPGMLMGLTHEHDRNPQRFQHYYALENCQVFYIPDSLLVWVMRRNFHVAENYMEYMRQEIGFLNQKLDLLTTGTAETRLALYLLQTGNQNRTMTEVSRELNLGRASLYRAIECLQGRRLIVQKGKHIEILDYEGLKEFINGGDHP